jgi:hypothetical protein
VIFNQKFFYHTPNALLDYLPEGSDLVDCLRLIPVAAYQPGYHLELVMDNDTDGRTVAYLAQD